MRPLPLVATAIRTFTSLISPASVSSSVLTRRDLRFPLLFDLGLIRLARVGVVVDLHLHDLFGRELGAAVFAQQTHRVRAALSAVAHHVHLAFAAVLQRLEFLRRRTALAVQSEHRAVLRRRDQRHDVVQESPAGLHRPVDFNQMLVIDPRNHHRVDLAQDAALGEHLQTLHLPLGQDPRRLHARVAFVLVVDPGIDLRADFGIDHVDRDRHVIHVELLDRVHVIRQHQAVGRKAQLDVGRGLVRSARKS